MFGLIPLLRKELTLLSRDVHALMVLFVMPAAFILIMSLSLQDKFQEQQTSQLNVGLVYQTPEDSAHVLGARFAELDGFNIEIIEGPQADRKRLNALAEEQSLVAVIVLPSGFFNYYDAEQIPPKSERIHLLFAPTAPATIHNLLFSAVSRLTAEHQVERLLASYLDTEEEIAQEKATFFGNNFFTQGNLYAEQDSKTDALAASESENESSTEVRLPSSVEQTVPAWLIFAMFFVVIPLSSTFIQERQQGTLQRLRTLPVSKTSLLLGKLLPYIGINVVQMILMFLVGILVLPLLGGQGITLHSNAWLLFPFSIVTSFAAVSFALMVASIVKTSEQATTIGGVSNLILAALGGIMVPTFVMPEMMQTVAGYSPMNWGLEGYLDIILRQADWLAILPEFTKLLVFGIVVFLLALCFFRRA